MKIQLEHNEIKINLELNGLGNDQLKETAKNVFELFLDEPLDETNKVKLSIHNAIVDLGNPETIRKTFVVSESLAEKLDNFCKKNKIKKSDAMNVAIDDFLKKFDSLETNDSTIIENEIIEMDSVEQDSPAQDSAEQEGPPPLPDPNDPEDNQLAMAAALEAYEKAQAAKKAAASTFGLGRLETPTAAPAVLGENGLPITAYRKQGGKTFYQTFIICTECRNKEKHFIERGMPFVNCKSCGKRNIIRPATTGNFPHIDSFNNIYIGGAFKRADEREQNFQAIQA